MQSYHWGLIAVVFVAAYVFARFFPQIGQKVGLP